MKVAYTIGSLNFGGMEVLLLDSLKADTCKSVERLLIHRKGGDLEKEFHNIKGIKALKLFPKWGRLIIYLCQLRKVFVKERVSIIHAQLWIDCIYAWIATIGLHIPILLTFHGYYLKKGIQSLPIKLAILMADRVCFVSQMEQNIYENYYGNLLKNKGVVIYNGVNFSKLKYSDKQKASEYPLQLCLVGSFGGVRSQEIIAMALAQLSDDMREKIEFYFIGGAGKNGGALLNECKQICKNCSNVHFLGPMGDIPELLSQMDAFVYSSRRDTFGIAVVEAMASGLPIVVNDYPVMKEITKDIDSVLLYRTNDVSDCILKIEELVENICTLRERAYINKIHIQNSFSIEQHNKQLEDLYESVNCR